MSDTSGNQSFTGQRTFTSGTSRYNLLQFVIKVLLGQIATATLVQVINVYPGPNNEQGTVDVQLLINQQDSQGNTVPHGIIYGLPYSRVQAGVSALIIDPVGKSEGYGGDIGVAVFASRDITSVEASENLQKLTSGDIVSVNPGSSRQLNYSDGIYLFSALSITEPTDYIKILPDGGIILLDRFDNEIQTTSTGVSITDASGNSIVTSSSGVVINGVTIPIGGISFNLKTHTHEQPNDSHGDMEQPTAAPTGGS